MKELSYSDAGVDIDEANRLTGKFKKLAKDTYKPEVLSGIGSFGALFSINMIKYKNPVLVSSTDGVGTKLKIAFKTGIHSTIGIDLVAMSVNDILTSGAEPLFFLDYLSAGNLKTIRAESIIEGIAKGCELANCSLIGGETAEMPGFYKDGEYDLAGFSVGVVEKDKIIDGSNIKIGDSIIGLASSGLHSNGFSLLNEVVFGKLGLNIDSKVKGLKHEIGRELLTPTKVYVKPILNLTRDFTIKGIAHITGGGLIENLPRILPKGCKVVIGKDSWDVPFIFNFLKENGNISEHEMYRTFNCGIGMVIVAPREESDDIIQRLNTVGENANLIGSIEEKTNNEEEIVLV